jgi:hypothetical protein
MSNERRKKRSETIQEAVQLYFEAVMQRSRIKAMALANEDGLLVAGAGGGYDHEWLAVLGVVGHEGHVDDMIQEISHGEGIESWDVAIHGRTLRVAAVGRGRVVSEDTSVALSRIFAPFFGVSMPIVAAG